MSEYSLKSITEELELAIDGYKQKKNAENKNYLSELVFDGFRFMEKSKAFVPDNKNDKYSTSVREELFPLLMQGQSILPTSAKMPIADYDFKNTDWLQYLPKSYLEYISKAVKKIKATQIFSSDKPYPISPYNVGLQKVIEPFLMNDALRPSMEGINFDEYGATGTDAHVLIHVTGKQEGDWKYGIYHTDKQLNADYKRLLKESGATSSDISFNDYEKKNRIIDEKYPNYNAVSDINDSEVFFTIDTQLMGDALKTMYDSRAVNLITSQIEIKYNSYSVYFNANFGIKHFRAWLELGVSKVDIWLMKGYIGEEGSNYSRPILLTKHGEVKGYLANQDELTYTLLMPVMKTYGVEESVGNRIEVIDENNVNLILGDSPAFKMSSGMKPPKSDESPLKQKSNSIIEDLEMTLPFLDGKEKQDTEELIADLLMAMEFESDSNEVKKYKKLPKPSKRVLITIDKKSDELNRQDLKEMGYDPLEVDKLTTANAYTILQDLQSDSQNDSKKKVETESKMPSKFEYDGMELTNDSAYLMTEEEFKEKVVPIIKEYKKFINKNDKYLKIVGYGGLGWYTYEDYKTDKKDLIRADYLMKSYSEEEAIQNRLARMFTGEFNEKWKGHVTPKDIADKNKEFQNKLRKYFSDEQIRYIDKDSHKTNKGNIRYAIDKDVYRKLLDAKKIELSKVQEIADSVNIKLPKKVYDIRTQVNMELEKERAKYFKNISQNNQDQMASITQKIIDKLKPIEEEVYINELNRYDTLLSEQVGKTFYPLDEYYNIQKPKIPALDTMIPIYHQLLNLEPTGKTRKGKVQRWRETEVVDVPEYKVVGLKDGFNKTLSKFVYDYVQSLKIKLIIAIYKDFSYITSPIKSFDFVELIRDAQGFQGEFKIVFDNGKVLYYNTQSIGAGGYNIQRFHYRYLTKFDLDKSDFDNMNQVYEMK